MDEESHNYSILFLCLFLFCVMMTLTMFAGITPEEIQSSSKMIIFSHPENAT